jgi:hypothetical protein
MLLDYSNKIEIFTYPNQKIFKVISSSFFGEETLKPLMDLIETKRFDWSEWTKYQIRENKIQNLLDFTIEEKILFQHQRRSLLWLKSIKKWDLR